MEFQASATGCTQSLEATLKHTSKMGRNLFNLVFFLAQQKAENVSRFCRLAEDAIRVLAKLLLGNSFLC